MSNNLGPLNPSDLKVETVSLLHQIDSLMKHHVYCLGNRHFNNQEQLHSQIERVENLDLRMAIIAQMNAGKSTIINAIIGQDILPTHDAAMTTLPTEIVQNNDLSEPLLILSKEIISAFNHAISKLQEKLNDSKFLEQYANELGNPNSGKANDGYIKSEIEKLKLGISVQAHTEGREAIIDTLRSLNHIIRICSKFLPEIDLLEKVSTVL